MFGLGVGKMGVLGNSNTLGAQISAIFSAAENGAWYERKDILAQYQDSGGVVQLSAPGQSVGLVLDKRFGLARGSEKITNGNFMGGATGWLVVNVDATHVATFGVGTLRYQSDTTSPQLVVEQSDAQEVGKTYEIVGVCSSYTSGSLKVNNAANATVIAGAAGSFRAIYTSNSPAFSLTRNTANVDVTLSSLSVVEVIGNSAKQPNAAARPLYQTAPARLVFDGGDDVLITTFAVALGSNCTVVRSVPGVGATILTGQTIGTSYVDSVTNSGLIIVNRPLTAAETAAANSWANQLAGV